MTRIDPVRLGLIGAGRIGTHHATALARRPGEAQLVADPVAGSAERLGESLGVPWLTDSQAHNGAIAVAEASFSAAYGYDVRAAVFGSAGMVTAGSPAHLNTACWNAAGVSGPTARADTDLFAEAYAAELAAFCAAVRAGTPTAVGGQDARAALRIALASIEAVKTVATVTIGSTDLVGAR